MGDDHREQRRYSVKARFMGAGGSTFTKGEIIDLNDTGVCLVADVSMTVGKQLHLEFELTTGSVEAVGEVRWVKAGEVGIKFVRISAPSLKAIKESLREQPAMSSPFMSPD